MNIRQIYWHGEAQEAMGKDTFAFCPFCGQPLSERVIDHRPRQACPDCGYVHFRNPLPTVSLVILQGNQVLLGKRPDPPGKDRWATPSGYIELDEDFLSTAVREAKEETGLEIEILSILNVTASFFPPDQHFLNLYLLARVTGGQLQAGDDMGEVGWFPLSGPLPEMAFQEDIDMIERCHRPGCLYLPVEGSTARSVTL